MVEAERNANYAINLLSTAEGALDTIDEKLIRMRALSVEASNGTLNSLDRSYLDVEFQQLKSEITRIASVTNYNGVYLIDGTYSQGASGARWSVWVLCLATLGMRWRRVAIGLTPVAALASPVASPALIPLAG